MVTKAGAELSIDPCAKGSVISAVLDPKSASTQNQAFAVVSFTR